MPQKLYASPIHGLDTCRDETKPTYARPKKARPKKKRRTSLNNDNKKKRLSKQLLVDDDAATAHAVSPQAQAKYSPERMVEALVRKRRI